MVERTEGLLCMEQAISRVSGSVLEHLTEYGGKTGMGFRFLRFPPPHLPLTHLECIRNLRLAVAVALAHGSQIAPPERRVLRRLGKPQPLRQSGHPLDPQNVSRVVVLKPQK